MTLLTQEAVVTLREIEQSNPFGSVYSELREPLSLTNEIPQWTKAIYADDVQIGLMTMYDVPGRPFCYIKQLDVDPQYLRMGFRRRALEELAAELRVKSRVEELVVTVEPQQGEMVRYLSQIGFRNYGEMVNGAYVLRIRL